MNKMIILAFTAVTMVLVNLGISEKQRTDELRKKGSQIEANNRDMKAKINERLPLVKHKPVLLSEEYALLVNEVKLLKSCRDVNMNVQLEYGKDAEDITDHYENTGYIGVRRLELEILVDHFTKETDMCGILDDIHLLEMNTDFIATQISKENNSLIIKGEVYGL